MTDRLLMLVFGCLIALSGYTQFDDDLDDFTLEEREPLTEAQAVERLETALDAAGDAERARLLLALFDELQANPETILPPREWAEFKAALANQTPAADIRERLPSLLKEAATAEVEPAATRRLNLALQLASAVGGIEPKTLLAILNQRPDADLQWLLPALGRVGGEDVLPTIQRYRRDEIIIPLNHPQNIRPVACAAVLGAAYAGDAEAMDQVLAWYEADAQDRSRFAFYVQWSIQEGLKPDYRVLDYCTQRYEQAERFLDQLPKAQLPALIQRANTQLPVALTDYLIRRQQRVPDDQLELFLPLLDNPALTVKAPVLRTFLQKAEPALRERAMGKLHAQLDSPITAERFAAATLLTRHAATPPTARLQQMAQDDPSPELRYRLHRLLDRP